jgi:hypothetical protein
VPCEADLVGCEKNARTLFGPNGMVVANLHCAEFSTDFGLSLIAHGSRNKLELSNSFRRSDSAIKSRAVHLEDPQHFS